jgi:HAD superfamily hydrolase (TIGR01509 family)
MNTHDPSPQAQLPAAVLWDFDGTLVDTEPIWFRSEYELMDELGGEWDDELARKLIGSDLLEGAAVMLRTAGRTDLTPRQGVERIVEKVVTALRAGEYTWRPGARELLARVAEAGIPCALVSASWAPILTTVLGTMPDHPFRVVIAGDDVTLGKPHPEPYLTAAARLGVRPADCLVVEDSATGAASGNAAGCVVAAVPNIVEIPTAPRRFHLESLAGVDVATLRDLMAQELVG